MPRCLWPGKCLCRAMMMAYMLLMLPPGARMLQQWSRDTAPPITAHLSPSLQPMSSRILSRTSCSIMMNTGAIS